ncbi:Centrosomal protein of 44 kDa [Schistosoma japonicum]|nr:Centrosomal protein of 44 kDa [Schistosoma japonicum]
MNMVLGQSSAFVEFYRHLLCDHNTNVTSYLVERGFGILGTTDNRFMEVLYRVLRDVFSFRPSITIAQFFMSGFAERKIEMATTVALNIESLIKRQEKNRIHSNQQQQQHGRYRHHNNHLKTNPSNLTYPQIPLVLPVVSLHHPIERNVEKSVSCDSKLCTKIGLSNEKDSFFCNDLSNGIDYISINDNKSVQGRECSQESRNCCSNRTNCKEAKFDKTTVSYADLNSHNQYEKLSKSDYNQHKCANHSSHLVNNNNPRRPYTSNTVYENCTKLSDYKLPTNTMSKSFNKMNRHSTVQIKSLDDLSDQKQHSKDNYYTSSSFHNKNINENLLFSGNIPSINQNNHSKLINHDDIQSIMNSLLQLTGKVNGMLTRMNKLESRLANVETDFSFNYHNGVSLLHNHMDATDNFGAKNMIKPNVTGKYNYLSMSLTDPLPTTSTFTETQCTVGIKHPMSSLTSTTASTAINSYNVTYADHRILSSSNKNNVNSKSSESLLLNPKRFTSMKLNIQDNDNQISCETVTDKIQNHNEKMSRLRETSDEQSVEIVTNNNFSPLHNSNRFNKICRDSSNKQGTLESVHPKFAKSSNQSSNLPDLNNPLVVDLDLKSEIQSHSAVSQNNSALRYRSKSSTGYYSVSRESSNNLFDDYSQHKVKMIPSLQLNSSSKSSQENNLLQEHSFVKINEILPNVNNNNSNNNNDITTNNSNNNHPTKGSSDEKYIRVQCAHMNKHICAMN